MLKAQNRTTEHSVKPTMSTMRDHSGDRYEIRDYTERRRARYSPEETSPSINGDSGNKTKRLIPISRRRRRWVSRDVSNFAQHEQVGEGTYGQVWSARDKETNEMVALKRVRMDNEREGFPLTAIREIKLLKTLQHENIVNLKEIVMGSSDNEVYEDGKKPKGSIYMVFEYMDHDLTGLMDTPNVSFNESQIKCYMIQLLKGLEYCHSREVLHRDVKGSNLLIDNGGNLKIADFGLARNYGEKGRKYTNRVITLWYRPPELLLGANEYGAYVDMWSVGCLLAELLTRKPLFPGKDELEETDLIFRLLGTPTEATWPGWKTLPQARNIPTSPGYVSRLNSHFQQFDDIPMEAVDLISKLLCLNPEKRLSASDALLHQWFRIEPRPASRFAMPRYSQSTHEFQAKRRRQASKHSPSRSYGRSRRRGENRDSPGRRESHGF